MFTVLHRCINPLIRTSRDDGPAVLGGGGVHVRGGPRVPALLLQVRHQGEELRGGAGRAAPAGERAAGRAAQAQGEEGQEGQKSMLRRAIFPVFPVTRGVFSS